MGPCYVTLTGTNGTVEADPGMLSPLLAAAGVTIGRPVLVVVGGADSMGVEHAGRAAELLRNAVYPVVADLGATVVDGGTHSGVMALLGDLFETQPASGDLVGVCPASLIAAPDGASGADAVPVDLRHSHLVLTPGTEWGDESPWLAATATAISAGLPTVTLLINGGSVARRDIDISLDLGRPVVVATNTGRLADELAAAHAPASVHTGGTTLLAVHPADASANLRRLLTRNQR